MATQEQQLQQQQQQQQQQGCEHETGTISGTEEICATCGMKLENEICVICQESKSGKIGFLVCTHSFCHSCIQEWFQQSHTCPICLTPSHDIFGAYTEIKSSHHEVPVLIPLDIDLDPGDEKLKGLFLCPCGRKWVSHNAYQNKTQKCCSCLSTVLPTSLVAVPKCEVAQSGTHKKDLCEMCLNLGKDCSRAGRFTKEDLDNFCQKMGNN